MYGLSFEALWKAIRLNSDRVAVPKTGSFAVKSGSCFKLGTSSIVCNGNVDVSVPRDTYLVAFHVPPGKSYEVDLIKYGGSTVPISGGSYAYESGMNAVIADNLVEVRSSTDSTVVITAVDWVEADEINGHPMISLTPSSGGTLTIFRPTISDFPFPHTKGIFAVAITNIEHGNEKDVLLTVESKMSDSEGSYTKEMKGFGFFVIRNETGYCRNSIHICDQATGGQCYPIYENINQGTALSVHGLAPILIPIEGKAVLKLASANVLGPTTCSCGFSIFDSIIYGVPS